MAAMQGCNLLKALIWLQVIFIGLQATAVIAADDISPQLNITSSIQDYVAQLERQYKYIIENDEAVVAEFRAGYERQLSTIDAQRVYIENELEIVDKKFYSLQFLNELSKHCVQKYRGLLYAITAVRLNINSCIVSARSNLNSILSSLTNTIYSMNNLINSNFRNGMADCQRKNNASLTNHTICVINHNNFISGSFNNNQRNFLTLLDTARCSADTRIRQTVECAFRTVNASLTSIGSTTNLIDGCVSGLELECAPCQSQIGNGSNNETSVAVPASEPQCNNIINVFTGGDIYRNATIRNPFVGLNSTLDCILVNFVSPLN